MLGKHKETRSKGLKRPDRLMSRETLMTWLRDTNKIESRILLSSTGSRRRRTENLNLRGGKETPSEERLRTLRARFAISSSRLKRKATKMIKLKAVFRIKLKNLTISTSKDPKKSKLNLML